MKAGNIKEADHLMNRLGCLNETMFIVRATSAPQINVQTVHGWRWIVGLAVSQDRLIGLLQLEIDDCLAKLTELGIEFETADEKKIAAATAEAARWL